MSRLSYLGCAALIAGLVLTTSLSAQQGRGRGGFGFGGQGGLARLATNEAVQKEIGATDEQKEKLKTLGEELAKDAQEEASAAGIGGGAGGFQNLTPEERAKLFEKMATVAKKLNDKYTPKVKETLKPEQFERLQQISYQAAGAGVYSNADVVKALDLTKEQQEKIATITKDFQEKQRALFGGGAPADGAREAAAKLRDEQNAELAKVLTAEQSEKLTKLKGKAFDTSVLGGGRGGPGGRPGGKGGDKKKVD
jgi:Spy/CpxP family protein refolding chaperone